MPQSSGESTPGGRRGVLGDRHEHRPDAAVGAPSSPCRSGRRACTRSSSAAVFSWSARTSPRRSRSRRRTRRPRRADRRRRPRRTRSSRRSAAARSRPRSSRAGTKSAPTTLPQAAARRRAPRCRCRRRRRAHARRVRGRAPRPARRRPDDQAGDHREIALRPDLLLDLGDCLKVDRVAHLSSFRGLYRTYASPPGPSTKLSRCGSAYSPAAATAPASTR